MKWQTQPKRGTCWVETDCGTWRVVQSSWPKPPKEPCPYVLWKLRPVTLIGGFASLKEAQEKARELA